MVSRFAFTKWATPNRTSRMKPFLFLLTLSLCGVAGAIAQGFAKTEFKDSAGTKLRYAILKPAKIKPDTKYPLVVSLHGSGGRGNQNWQGNCAANMALGKPERRQKYPCYIIAPTVGRNERWSGAPLTALMELIKSSLKKHPIDPARIYVTGQSMGGAGTYSAILKEPHLFAAAVPVCGRGQPDLAKKIVHLPIWIFHGEKDSVVPTRHSQEMVEALKKAGGKPIYTEYAGVRHNSWTPAYAEKKLWKWLFTQKRKDIKSKLTPKQVSQFFDDLLGKWTAVDKDTKAVVEKFTCVWKKKGESVKWEGTTFENGKITGQSTSITSYDPELGVFVEKYDQAKGQPEKIRQLHWNPNNNTLEAEFIKPKFRLGMDLKMTWKKIGANLWNHNIEVFEKGKLVFYREVIQTRKAPKTEK
jgi:poly(3-hydroxybutyrate) depolymerase